jgi:ABC-type glutathione transport system ATPase component
MTNVLEVRDLTKTFRGDSGLLGYGPAVVKALDRVSFTVGARTTLGIVGESGCGKTTLAKIILGLVSADSGAVEFNFGIITRYRKDCQIIFQNPYNSLDPRMTVFQTVSEPMVIHRMAGRNLLKDKVAELLQAVGLEAGILSRYPHEFSGGQRQRICIARALATEPKFLILDEPISSLDLTIQAKLLDLFVQLKERFNLTYLFISHNLAVVKHLADRVMVMKDGRVVELAAAAELFEHPRQEYTRQLLDAAR